MAHIFANGILETCTLTGTGNATLTGAVLGYRTFASKCAVNDTVHYRIEAVNGLGVPTGLYELGRGTYSATNTLTRTTVYESSNANALENFAGAVRVSITVLSPTTHATVAADWIAALTAMDIGSAQTVTGQKRFNANVSVATSAAAWGGVVPVAIDVGTAAGIGANTDRTAYFAMNNYYSGSAWTYKLTGVASLISLNADGSLTHNTAASGTGGTGITFSEKFRISAGGDGTITGQLAVATGMGFRWDGGNSNFLGMGSGITGPWCWQWNRTNGNLAWLNSGAGSIFSIDGSGNTACGGSFWAGQRVTANSTEAPSLYSPNGGVYVNHNYGLYVAGNHNSGGNYYVNLASGDPAYGNCQYYLIHVPGSFAAHEWAINGQGFRFRHDGWGEANAGFRAVSDGNVKINRAVIEDALDKVDQLTGYTYDRTDITDMDGSLLHAAGLIAQDVQAVLPATVSQGKPTEEDPDPIRRLSYDGVVALLVNAVKELRAEVKDLRKQLEDK